MNTWYTSLSLSMAAPTTTHASNSPEGTSAIATHALQENKTVTA